MQKESQRAEVHQSRKSGASLSRPRRTTVVRTQLFKQSKRQEVQKTEARKKRGLMSMLNESELKT